MDRPDTLQKSAADNIASYCMTDVGPKNVSHRIAQASGSITMKPETLRLILKKALPKGDCLALAEVSGLLAVKKLSEILPLCHPISLESIKVSCTPNKSDSAVYVRCSVSTHAKTGVEMEALAGVQGALLCIYDLCKPFDRFMTIQNVGLDEKRGGKSGTWIRPDVSRQDIADNQTIREKTTKSWSGFSFSLLTVSDRANAGEYPDQSGQVLKDSVEGLGAEVLSQDLVPDEFDLISNKVSSCLSQNPPDCLIITGGTGAAKRDVTPEVLQSLSTKIIPGIGEALRVKGSEYTPYSWLSRSLGCVIQDRLVIALPGSPKAVRESLDTLGPMVPHLLKLIKGKKNLH